MTTENIDKLEAFVLSLGVSRGDLKDHDLIGLINKGGRQFNFTIERAFDEESGLEVELHFHEFHDGYYLSHLLCTHHDIKLPHRTCQQWFWMWEMRPTLRTIWNLMAGRSAELTVFTKTGVQQRLWMKIDYSAKFTSNEYRWLRWVAGRHYSITKVLKEYKGIVETLHPESLEVLAESLRLGNRELVTIKKSGYRPYTKMLIEANPEGGLLKFTKCEMVKGKAVGDARKPESVDWSKPGIVKSLPWNRFGNSVGREGDHHNPEPERA
jgi:hypothetical protein